MADRTSAGARAELSRRRPAGVLAKKRRMPQRMTVATLVAPVLYTVPYRKG